MADRYTRVVLTVIAACLVYLCLVVSGIGTPVRAQTEPQQQGAQRPGLLTGPAEVVIVGWRGAEGVPVVVRNTVTTAPAVEGPARVVIAGWEDQRGAAMRLSQDAGIPVNATAATRPSRVVIAGTEPAPPAMWRQRVPVETERAAPAR